MTEVGHGNVPLRLRTGDRVRVDGGRGIVEMLDIDWSDCGYAPGITGAF